MSYTINLRSSLILTGYNLINFVPNFRSSSKTTILPLTGQVGIRELKYMYAITLHV